MKCRSWEPVASAPSFAAIVVMALLTTTSVRADTSSAASAQPPSTSPGAGVSLDQKLGAQVPLDIDFVDEAGAPVLLGDYLADKPVILHLAYFGCPMLCRMSIDGLTRVIDALALVPGDDYTVLTVSFDPREDAQLAATARKTALSRCAKPNVADGWHFLTGRPEAIDRLTDAVGFRYRFDEHSGQFAHPSGLIVVTPQGRISRYLPGVSYPANDVRLSLVEASDGKIGSPSDQLLLLCYQYDPTTGRYGLAILSLLRVAGIVTVAALAIAIVWMIRRERRARRIHNPAASP